MGNKRGRPKNSFEDLYDEHLWERLCTGKASETVEEEARYLDEWGHKNSAFGPNGFLKPEQIRKKINKRYGGAVGYQQVRNWKLMELGYATT
jgi:hypothetical protein